MPAEVIAHEVLARLANPVLMRFLPQVPHQGDEWAADLVDRLVKTCGHGTPDLWRIRLSHDEAPALEGRLDGTSLGWTTCCATLPTANTPWASSRLALLRDGERTMAPGGDVLLRADDQLLLAGRLRARAAWTPR